MGRVSLSYPNPSLGDMADITTELRESAGPPAVQNAVMGKGRRAVLVVSLLVGLLFSTLDTSIVSTSLLAMVEDLNDFVDAPWVVLAYLLTYMGFAVCIAKLSDIYGRRNMIVLSWVVFIAFSMGCALSETMLQLIVCRAFQGLGGSGLYSLTQIGLIEVGPVHRPSLIGALIGLTLGVAFVTGPIVGGLISHYVSWRWIFNINIPFGLVTVIGIVNCWPEENVASLFSWTAFRSIDFIGGLALLCASGFLVFGIQQGGSGLLGWRDPAVIAALVIAVLSWALFIGWEMLLSKERLVRIQPMFPMRLIKQRVYMAALIVTLLTGFPHIALTVIVPERFQIVAKESSLTAGLHLLPLLSACAIGSFLAGAISSRRNNTSPTLIAASALQLIGVGLMTMLDTPESDVRAQYGFQAIFGLGVGLSYGAATIMTGIYASRAIGGVDEAGSGGADADIRSRKDTESGSDALGVQLAEKETFSTSERASSDHFDPESGRGADVGGGTTQGKDTTTTTTTTTTGSHGIGIGIGTATATDAGASNYGQKDLAAAQGAVAQARVLGGCIGVAVCTVVFNARTSSVVTERLGLSMAQFEELRQSPLTINSLSATAQEQIRSIYAGAFAEETRIMVYVCVAMFLVSFATWEHRKTAMALERLTRRRSGKGC